jgi:ATP-dependent RNA helicase MSS116
MVATVGAMVAHEVGAEGPRRDARQGPAFPRVVTTTARGGRGAGEQGAGGVEGSASNADKSAHEAGGVDGTYLTETR